MLVLFVLCQNDVLNRDRSTLHGSMASEIESQSDLCIGLGVVRLVSRRPVWLEELQEEPSTQQKWIGEWSISDVIKHSLIEDSTVTRPDSTSLVVCGQQMSLNRFRTGQGRCADLVCWNHASDPSGSCGAPSWAMWVTLVTLGAPLRRYYSRDISVFSAIEMRCIILRYINFLLCSILFYNVAYRDRLSTD